ncbi:hypothetical protein F0310_04350 (plasmid) [Borrelia sp. A-FGy1]|uniref:hypothetical protein n=1 Tax=Borrelia sp. A-FGy1 TaxID=2608247 RepID=UPI0015F5B1DF|nr:hypothetical protein [Borrelia sp. A-FGy1]QMU99649.1 hypothetical protein F0310_04350 [Borrelia sp. A-FGy1]
MLYLNILALLSALLLPSLTLFFLYCTYYKNSSEAERVSMLAEKRAESLLDLVVCKKKLIKREEIYYRYRVGDADFTIRFFDANYKVNIRERIIATLIYKLKVAMEAVYDAFWKLLDTGYDSSVVDDVLAKLSQSLIIILFANKTLDDVSSLDINEGDLKKKIDEFVIKNLGPNFVFEEYFASSSNVAIIHILIYNFASILLSNFMLIYTLFLSKEACDALYAVNTEENIASISSLTNAVAFLTISVGQIKDLVKETLDLKRKKDNLI